MLLERHIYLTSFLVRLNFVPSPLEKVRGPDNSLYMQRVNELAMDWNELQRKTFHVVGMWCVAYLWWPLHFTSQRI